MAITPERLTETFQKYKSKYYGKPEDYFAPLYISDKFDRPLEAVIGNCAFGHNDAGFTAYHIEKGARNLYLYIFNWSDDYELFKVPFKRLIKTGIENIFGDDRTAPESPLIAKLKYSLEEYQDLINKVYVCFVFNGAPEQAEESRVLESLREELESKKHFIDSYFNDNEITLTIQYISNETKKINQTSRSKKTFQYEISYKAQ